MTITSIIPRAILSSMGNETVEVTLTYDRDFEVSAAIPAGISAGQYERKNLPVKEAILQIESIKSSLIGTDYTQESLDDKLIGMDLAGNASLPISAAFWKAGQSNKNLTSKIFPKLMVLLFEGGKHGSGGISMQEFMIIEDSVSEALENFKSLKKYLESQKISSTVGAEGGFSPQDFDNSKVLETIKTLFPNKDLALDIASTFSNSEINYDDLLNKYRLVSIEDPYAEEEWDKWSEFYAKYGKMIMVVGDDLTVTNIDRLNKALNPQVINAIVIKPNQNGTITGALRTAKLAKEMGLKVVVSHRGEETDDNWIVDFALAAGANFVKFGGMNRGERIAKYNRLRTLGMS